MKQDRKDLLARFTVRVIRPQPVVQARELAAALREDRARIGVSRVQYPDNDDWDWRDWCYMVDPF